MTVDNSDNIQSFAVRRFAGDVVERQIAGTADFDGCALLRTADMNM
ncbi:hypothetical protein [Paenibacillus sp. FJAT-26967]|nr:hypothetical protein [Paenibacillus sp. FJAT-26967]